MRIDEETQIKYIIERLVARYPEIRPAVVEQAVADARDEFADARVRDFVPLLVNRKAKRGLAQMTR